MNKIEEKTSVNLSPEEYKKTAIVFLQEILNYAKHTHLEEMVTRRIEMLQFYNIKKHDN